MSAVPKVAMVGGGQLARMTHQAAIALGQSLRVLATDPGDPAAQVCPDVVIGSHTDLEALRIQDRVFMGGDHVDPGYAARREGAARRGQIRAGTALIARGEFSLVIIGLVSASVDTIGAVATPYVFLLAIAGPLLARLAK